jgi:hypothetical protein
MGKQTFYRTKKILAISILVLLVMTSMVAVISAQGEDEAAESENGDNGDNGDSGDTARLVATTGGFAKTGGFTRALTCNFIPRPQRHFENCVQKRFCDGRMIPCRTPSGQQYFKCSGRVHTGWVCTTLNTGRACNWMLRNCR